MLKRVLCLVAGAVLMSACGAPEERDVNEVLGNQGDPLSSLPNETAWAVGTNWSYESNFAGLAKAWVYTPTRFSKKVPDKRAVVFHLIGCGQLPFQVAQGAGWAQAAEAYGMVVVIPEIAAPTYPNKAAPNIACYNYGDGLASQPTRNSPDPKALIAAGQRIAVDYPTLKIDTRQIYLAGLSAGATVAMEVACMAPEVFAGVASMAGAAMGTQQSRAVMPPSTTEQQVKSQCTSYLNGSSAPNALQSFKEQVYLIASDNNGLPAGNPVFENGAWTADKFKKQTFWDGDKFVPHLNHTLATGALASLLGVQKTDTQVALPLTGSGVGCPGGVASHDDTGEVECNLTAAVARSWTVKADIWKDAQGRSRIVHLEQDTLRHRWPAGPIGALDKPVTPDRQWLIANGYVKADGFYDDAKMATAANGTLGSIFFANDAFDLPMYVAELWAENNPRLTVVTPPATNPVVSAQAAVNAGATKVTLTGAVTAATGSTVVSVKATLQGTETPATIPAGQAQVSYTLELDVSTFAPGTYSVTVRATDNQGRVGTTTASFQLQGTQPGGTCVTATNSAHLTAGRAHRGAFSYNQVYANGSNDFLGFTFLFFDQTSSVQEQAAGTWKRVASCP